MSECKPMIRTLLDVCRFILEDQGEAQSSYWLASQAVEMRLWRASESDVRDALDKDIEKNGESSLFLKVAEDEYALRSWTAEQIGGNWFHDEATVAPHFRPMARRDQAGHRRRP